MVLAPPIVLFDAPFSINTPSTVFPRLAPLASVPMKLPSTTLPVAPDPVISMPSLLKPMVLAPPIVLFDALFSINTPSTKFPRRHRWRRCR